MQVKTGSMENAISVDDIVIEKIIKNKNEIKVNDIVTYKKDNYLITHRVKKVLDNTIITQGDANNTEDEPIEKKEVVAKTIKVIHNVAIWKKVFKTKSVYIPLLLTLIMFIITISIKDEKKVEELDEKKEKKE